jgi:hypothetical protein
MVLVIGVMFDVISWISARARILACAASESAAPIDRLPGFSCGEILYSARMPAGNETLGKAAPRPKVGLRADIQIPRGPV